MFLIQYDEAIFAMNAAILWYRSTKVKLPSSIDVGVASLYNTGGALSFHLRRLAKSLGRQSDLNAKAALCAATAAVLQVIDIVLSFTTS